MLRKCSGAPEFATDAVACAEAHAKCSPGEALDVDNVPKPILDAMSGLVFADDAQVTDLLCRKRDVKLPLDIDRPSPLLLGTFDRRDEFLHVLVTDTPTMEVVPW